MQAKSRLPCPKLQTLAGKRVGSSPRLMLCKAVVGVLPIYFDNVPRFCICVLFNSSTCITQLLVFGFLNFQN